MPDSRCYKGLQEFLKLGIYCVLMTIIGNWANNFIIFMSGYLTVNE